MTKRDPSILLATILYYLLQKFTLPFPSSIAALMEHLPLYGRRDILRLRDLLCEVAKELGDVFIIIDGLDECEQREHLLPILRYLAGCVRLFITSRDDRDIRTSFEEYLSYRISIQPSDVHRDIQNFVEKEIQERCLKIPVLAGSHSLLDAIARTLVERAEGM
jgi:hypothetical protein